MNAPCIKAIIRKDVISAKRNNLVLMALLSGVLFSLVYYVLPADIDQEINFGISSADPLPFYDSIEREGVELSPYADITLLTDAVVSGDVVAGLMLPEGFMESFLRGESPAIELYVRDDLTQSARDSLAYVVETVFDMAAYGKGYLPFDIHTVEQDVPAQMPLRQMSIPLYIIMALVMEMWTVSTLIVEESAAGTIKAVLVTPASPSDIIAAKGVVGCVYAIGVAAAILLLTQTIRGSFPALALALLLGALLAVSLGLFLGSLTDNITGSYIYVSIPLIILILPALTIFLQDVSVPAMKFIPTYYLVNAFNDIINYGATIADVAKDLIVIAFFDAAFFLLGVASIRRRFQ